jgi:hypothetical protein
LFLIYFKILDDDEKLRKKMNLSLKLLLVIKMTFFGFFFRFLFTWDWGVKKMSNVTLYHLTFFCQKLTGWTKMTNIYVFKKSKQNFFYGTNVIQKISLRDYFYLQINKFKQTLECFTSRSLYIIFLIFTNWNKKTLKVSLLCWIDRK